MFHYTDTPSGAFENWWHKYFKDGDTLAEYLHRPSFLLRTSHKQGWVLMVVTPCGDLA